MVRGRSRWDVSGSTEKPLRLTSDGEGTSYGRAPRDDGRVPIHVYDTVPCRRKGRFSWRQVPGPGLS